MCVDKIFNFVANDLHCYCHIKEFNVLLKKINCCSSSFQNREHLNM